MSKGFIHFYYRQISIVNERNTTKKNVLLEEHRFSLVRNYCISELMSEVRRVHEQFDDTILDHFPQIKTLDL